MSQRVLLDAEQLADALGIRPRTVRHYARSGMIPEIVISPKVRRFDYPPMPKGVSPIPHSSGFSKAIHRPFRHGAPSVRPRHPCVSGRVDSRTGRPRDCVPGPGRRN